MVMHDDTSSMKTSYSLMAVAAAAAALSLQETDEPNRQKKRESHLQAAWGELEPVSMYPSWVSRPYGEW